VASSLTLITEPCAQNVTDSLLLLQLLLSVRDVDDQLVVLSLNALATLVPVLGGDLVIGEGRQQLFSRCEPKVCCSKFGKDNNNNNNSDA